VNFWDLSGHETFFEVRNEFYKDTQGVLLVFDASNQASFQALDGCLKEAKKFGLQNIPGALCANKVDLKRAISEEEGRAFSKANGLAYFETSASSGANVSEMFETIFNQIMKKQNP
jgi:DnaJ family protein C protein 27